MAILIKKVVNHIFTALFHDTLPELRATYKYKLLIVTLMGLLAAVAISTLVYYN